MTTLNLDGRRRAAVWRALEERRFDLLVIGGGITGAGIARDAALRGLSVALVEARDYASGTSSRSSKMIHGGLRYLSQGDIALVKEAASERQILRRIAPHLARIMPFLIPVPSLASLAKLRAGLWSFEKLGGVPESERHEVLNVAQFAAREPLMRVEGLNGAVAYPEFLTDDARLVLANIRSAQAAGAVVLNYAEARALLFEEGRTAGALVRSMLTGETNEVRIRARLVVNAAGPWLDAVRALERDGAEARLSLSRGIHLVFARARLPVENTLILRAEDKRSIFVVPRGDFTYVGTTDTFYPSSDYWPKITQDDVAYLLRAVERWLKTPKLVDGDIVALWAGVRPLIAEPGKKANEVSRKDEIWTAPSGLVSIGGGKLSAYRAMAARVVDLVVERLEATARACATAEAPLPGAEGLEAARSALSHLGAQGERLIGLYGGEASSVVADGGDVAVEARRAVTSEGAVRLEDYWVRRSARAWFDVRAGLDSLVPAAAAMGALLGWDAQRQADEVAHCTQLEKQCRSALRPDAREMGHG